jgi:dipeptidyl aminopeptidase
MGSWKLSDDMKHVLVKTSHLKVSVIYVFIATNDFSPTNQQWRHSSFGNYYVHNIAEGETRPIIPPSYPPKTAYATWSPTGNGIAFVMGNDLYVLPSVEYVISVLLHS